MSKFFECTVEVVIGVQKNGKNKIAKELFLVDAMSVTEAEAKVYRDFETTSGGMEFKVNSAKESRVLRVIE